MRIDEEVSQYLQLNHDRMLLYPFLARKFHVKNDVMRKILNALVDVKSNHIHKQGDHFFYSFLSPSISSPPQLRPFKPLIIKNNHLIMERCKELYPNGFSVNKVFHTDTERNLLTEDNNI